MYLVRLRRMLKECFIYLQKMCIRTFMVLQRDEWDNHCSANGNHNENRTLQIQGNVNNRNDSRSDYLTSNNPPHRDGLDS